MFSAYFGSPWVQMTAEIEKKFKGEAKTQHLDSIFG